MKVVSFFQKDYFSTFCLYFRIVFFKKLWSLHHLVFLVVFQCVWYKVKNFGYIVCFKKNENSVMVKKVFYLCCYLKFIFIFSEWIWELPWNLMAWGSMNWEWG